MRCCKTHTDILTGESLGAFYVGGYSRITGEDGMSFDKCTRSAGAMVGLSWRTPFGEVGIYLSCDFPDY